MTYFFETYGCQMNIAESASVEQLLIARGWRKAGSAEVSDMVIINTCSVRATAETRIFGRLGYFDGLKKLRSCAPDAKSRSLEKAAEYSKTGFHPLTVVVMGCMAERLLKSLQKDYPVVDYVVGTFAKKNFGGIISAVEERNEELATELKKLSSTTIDQNEKNDILRKQFSYSKKVNLDDEESYKFASISYEQGSFTSFVPIMHGCNNFCTYCIVPYVRGREVSRPVESRLQEVDVLSKYGVKQRTHLGQNVNSYHGVMNEGDTGIADINFPALLKRVTNHLRESDSPIKWVRFISSHPKDLSDELIDVIANDPLICHHIHLPVQNGSTRVLKEMNRRYTREDYLALVNRIRTRIPDISLTTDVMLGFPGETDDDVADTISLMKEVRYESAFMYSYNPREGTPAATMANQIPVEEKKDRLQKIIDLQLVITREEMTKRIGSTVEVLVQSVSRDNEKEVLAKTPQDENIVFEGDKSLIGNFARVNITALNGNTF